jgi:hypothetical protein
MQALNLRLGRAARREQPHVNARKVEIESEALLERDASDFSLVRPVVLSLAEVSIPRSVD